MKVKRTTSSRKSSERGQSLVELAISLTVMLLLLSGAVTFGMALFSYVGMRDAAQEGALWGSFNPFLDQQVPLNGLYDPGEPVNWQNICNRVKAASSSPVDMTAFTCSNGGTPGSPNNIDVQAILTTGGGGLPCEGPATGSGVYAIQVTVTYQYQIFMPLIGAIIGQNIPLTAQVSDTILEPKCP